MKTEIISQNDTRAASIARDTLKNGGVIAFATDTVYGVGCLVHDADAIQRIYAIKERDQLKAIPVLIGGADQLLLVAQEISPMAQNLTAEFWPGALTVIVKKRADLPQALTMYDTVGVRMPDHDWLRNLITTCGPLAVTSANISGQPSLATAEEVYESLTGRIDLLVDGGRCDGGVPSTVVDCSEEPVKILRAGAIREQVLQSMASQQKNE